MKTIKVDDGKTFSVQSGGFVMVDEGNEHVKGSIRIGLACGWHEVESAYMTPAQAREVAAALLATADEIDPPLEDYPY